MVKREVVWTVNAENKLFEILDFFTERNKSDTYSLHLYDRFEKELEGVAYHPGIGIKTSLDQIKGLIMAEYILFYEITEDKVIVLKVWDCRENPEKRNIPD